MHGKTQKVILSFSINGIFLSAILLYFNARKFTAALYLGGFFLCLSFYFLYHYVLLYSGIVRAVSFLLLTIPFFGSLIYLIGPMFRTTDLNAKRSNDYFCTTY